jgi:hypothetical protein
MSLAVNDNLHKLNCGMVHEPGLCVALPATHTSLLMITAVRLCKADMVKLLQSFKALQSRPLRRTPKCVSYLATAGEKLFWTLLPSGPIASVALCGNAVELHEVSCEHKVVINDTFQSLEKVSPISSASQADLKHGRLEFGCRLPNASFYDHS